MQLKAPSRVVRVRERGRQDTRAALFMSSSVVSLLSSDTATSRGPPAAGLSPPLPAARTPGRCARGDAVTCWPVCPPLAALSPQRHRSTWTLRTPRRAPRRSARRTRAPHGRQTCARSRRSRTCRSAERGARGPRCFYIRANCRQPVFALAAPDAPTAARRTHAEHARLLARRGPTGGSRAARSALGAAAYSAR